MKQAGPEQRGEQGTRRWVCTRHDPPILLGVVEADGTLQFKVRQREWTVRGFTEATAICPKCGGEHTLRSDDI